MQTIYVRCDRSAVNHFKLALGLPGLQYPCRASWNLNQNLRRVLNWNFHLKSSSVVGSLRMTKTRISPRSRKRVDLRSLTNFS